MKKVCCSLLFFSLPLCAGWNWEELEKAEVEFPREFLFGTAVSEFQVSGGENLPHSQWAFWEAQEGLPIKTGERSRISADEWHLMERDVALMKELGVNAFRFSLDWSQIEPREGEWNEEAMVHYERCIDLLLEHQITPMVTLHHFVHPQWFEGKGGFEKRENIPYFVRFSQEVFARLGSKVPLWCTINEPTIFALMGYFLGEFPPGKKDPFLTGIVLRNLLLAHVKTYFALKEMDGGEEVAIGIVHQHLKFIPFHTFNPVEKVPCFFLTDCFHTSLMHFFETGDFDFYLPTQAIVTESESLAPRSFDFFGVNYYSRAVLKGQWSLEEPLVATCFEGEVMTDMPYAIYPEGFYEALIECARFGKPIYVTENGIADAQDVHRALFIKRYLYALYKALAEGVDVRGYFYWSLLDNFEWGEGFSKKFGLYEVDFQTLERRLRPGALAYQKILLERNRGYVK